MVTEPRIAEYRDMPSGANILVVEDEREVTRTVVESLRGDTLNIDQVATIADARKRLATRTFDMLILDLGLPDGDGRELAKALRAAGSDIPILMLTGQASVQQRVDGFAHGADDYVCKPFAPEELLMRVRSLLRRARPERQHMLRYADIELDLLTRTVRMPEGETSLSDREAALLAFLLRHPEEPVSRERLAQEIWGLDGEYDSGVVNVYINYLRNKLERGDRHGRLIHTLRGVGYVLSERAPD